MQSVVYAFARSPSIQRGRSEAAATVLRDAFAQAWQVTARLLPELLAGVPGGGPRQRRFLLRGRA